MQFEATNKLANKLVEYEKQVSEALFNSLQTMRSEMSKIYEKFEKDGLLTKSEMTMYNRYANMEKQMMSALDPALKENLKTIKRLTPEMYNEAFFREAWLIDNTTGLRLNWGTINTDVILENLANEYDKIAYENYPRNAKQAIRKALTDGLTLGKSFPQMMRDLKKAMNITNANAMRILRTEGMTAMNAAMNDAWLRAEEKGVQGDIVWDATLDSKTRPDHGHADGQVRDKKTGMFTIGGEPTPYPAWEGLTAAQRINCRCHTRLQIEGYEPQLRRTREQGVIPFQTYDEWKKNYPIKVKAKTPKTPKTPVIPAIPPAMPKTKNLAPSIPVEAPRKTTDVLAEEAIKASGIENINYAGFDPIVAEQVTLSAINNTSLFPKLKEKVNGIFNEETIVSFATDKVKKTSLSDGTKNMIIKKYKNTFSPSNLNNAFALQLESPYVEGIIVPKKWASNPTMLLDKITKTVSDGFHPKGTATIKAMIDHEFGHSIDSMLNISSSRELKLILDEHRKFQSVGAGLSTYALKNSRELVAEAWSEYLNNPVPRPLAKQIGDLIKEKYKLKYGDINGGLI